MADLILTYHCARLESHHRRGHDLNALDEDLALLAERGIAVLPLPALLRRDSMARADGHAVALTFDDGTRLDVEPIVHRTVGPVEPLLAVLRRHVSSLPRLHATLFVIASAKARADLSEALADDFGPDLMSSHWWAMADADPLLAIENHSWDHHHPALRQAILDPAPRGSFAAVAEDAAARAQIAAASDAIGAITARRPRYFAYPYGDMPAWLADHWLPQHGPSLGLAAALGTVPEPLTAHADRWRLPRYVHGRDWSDTAGLERLLDDAR